MQLVPAILAVVFAQALLCHGDLSADQLVDAIQVSHGAADEALYNLLFFEDAKQRVQQVPEESEDDEDSVYQSDKGQDEESEGERAEEDFDSEEDDDEESEDDEDDDADHDKRVRIQMFSRNDPTEGEPEEAKRLRLQSLRKRMRLQSLGKRQSGGIFEMEQEPEKRLRLQSLKRSDEFDIVSDNGASAADKRMRLQSLGKRMRLQSLGKRLRLQSLWDAANEPIHLKISIENLKYRLEKHSVKSKSLIATIRIGLMNNLLIENNTSVSPLNNYILWFSAIHMQKWHQQSKHTSSDLKLLWRH